MVSTQCCTAVEAIPTNALLPRGEEVYLCMFVNSDHAGNKQTRISRTRFIIYRNMSLMKQSTIETIVLGSVFVAIKVGVNTLHDI